MNILLAKDTDLIEILYLLRVCVLDMNMKGLKHWNSACPGAEQMQKDLDNKSIYLVKDRGVCKGMITLDEQEPDDYKQLQFATGRRPLFIRNMAVHPRWQRKGIAKLMIDFAFNQAREKGFDCIRLDVFQPSDNARQLYENQSFKEVSSFLSSYQKIPFVCYEKQI